MTTTPDKKKSYKDSLNLPQTPFPMEAKLVQNEPARLQHWKDINLYQQLLDSRPADKKWILHDGPPFANGDIHIGHLINKTLKDVVLRFRSLQGFQTPYVPGWDCHGLPIEHKIQQDLGPKIREMSTVDVRQRCFAYAEKYASIQSVQFQRLGILGDWAHPYLTMTPDYEASTLEVFAKFVEAGLVYKKLKPVPWSVANQTALADAELEYKDVEDPSIYVEFPFARPDRAGLARDVGDAVELYYLVWTTTPWTLPANLAIAIHPEVSYALVRYEREGKQRAAVVAAELVERVFNLIQPAPAHSIVKTVKGIDLLGSEYRHPFIDRIGRVVAADYVTTTDGTGLVHTAPGHGEDDYETGIREGLDVYSPVMANGRFDDTAPEFIRGKSTKEANPLIMEDLAQRHLLFKQVPILHSYPHDWRSKTPIIFRATEQWFIAMDQPFKSGPSLRDRAREAVADTRFVPDWGKARITGMLESRPDWCISRQRAWGLPIPVFYNEKGDALLTPDSVRAVSKRFAEKGSDAWFTDSPADLLGSYDPGPNFPKDKLRKERDIFDVWFESGSSWHGVLLARPQLKFPADMYLEGSDQHRGWFQLSLLPALGAAGQAPFKSVLTHGFVVKPDGTKVSKSDKEYVTATKEIETHGADLLRLWCCSVDYQNDIPASPQALKEFGDKYRKIRNTLRYLLSNLYDYAPSSTDNWEPGTGNFPLNSLDAWALSELDTLITDVTSAYDAYQLHRAFRLLHDFCAVQISAVYGNAMKDRLYCEAPSSPLRRRTQFVMHRMVVALTKLLSPMLVFTADEAWQHIPHKPADEANLPSVHLAHLPKPSGLAVSDQQREDWKTLMTLRDEALAQLDRLKKEVGLNKALDAEVVYHINNDDLRRRLQDFGPDLEDLVGAGHHSFAESPSSHPAVTVQVLDRRQTYPACARSWKRRPDVGQNPSFPDLSLRDALAMRRLASDSPEDTFSTVLDAAKWLVQNRFFRYWEHLWNLREKNSAAASIPLFLVNPEKVIFYFGPGHLAVEYLGQDVGNAKRSGILNLQAFDYTKSDDFFGDILGFRFGGSSPGRMPLGGFVEGMYAPTDQAFDIMHQNGWNFAGEPMMLGLNVAGFEFQSETRTRLLNCFFYGADDKGLLVRNIKWMDVFPLKKVDLSPDTEAFDIEFYEDIPAQAVHDSHIRFPRPTEFQAAKLAILNRFVELFSSSGVSETDITRFLAQKEHQFILKMAFAATDLIAEAEFEWSDKSKTPIRPDFFIREPSGWSDIVECKLPTLKGATIVGRDNRETFSAELQSYVAQTRVYAEYFRDPRNCEVAKAKYGLNVSTPKRWLVAGRRYMFTSPQWKSIEADFRDFGIRTYDDVVDTVRSQLYS